MCDCNCLLTLFSFPIRCWQWRWYPDGRRRGIFVFSGQKTQIFWRRIVRIACQETTRGARRRYRVLVKCISFLCTCYLSPRMYVANSGNSSYFPSRSHSWGIIVPCFCYCKLIVINYCLISICFVKTIFRLFHMKFFFIHRINLYQSCAYFLYNKCLIWWYWYLFC